MSSVLIDDILVFLYLVRKTRFIYRTGQVKHSRRDDNNNDEFNYQVCKRDITSCLDW